MRVDNNFVFWVISSSFQMVESYSWKIKSLSFDFIQTERQDNMTHTKLPYSCKDLS
jgi:hypothetical protein